MHTAAVKQAPSAEPPRADVVGSLLRRPDLSEDEAVDAALRLQEACGLDVVTDGEQRRLSFQAQMTAAVDGFGDPGLDAFLWGSWRGGAVGDADVERPTGLGVISRLSRRRPLSVGEFLYARDRTEKLLKVTLPSPGLFSQFWAEGGPYATAEELLRDCAAILREEVAELCRLGCRYVQLDAPHYPLLLDPRWRDFYARRGTLELWLELDNDVLAAAPPGVLTGFHLCRGNQGSRWLIEGGYEPLAEEVFGTISAARLLLEYDDERSGGFEPLRHVRGDAVAVLGLVTTKTARREEPAELARRVEQAARHLPLERLAVSPQCGFGTSVVGNAIAPADQERKLRTVAETARLVWG
jgi:5-methyltetrahydropteroyltriglutamate--homocysteine methyltransferase